MPNKRWDIELDFLDGPMSKYGARWYQGDRSIELGRRPSPGGVDLSSYLGVADVHARIQAYSGNKVSLSPIQHHEIRVAEHENVDWNNIHPLRKPAFLTSGNVIHIGPLWNQCRIKLLQCRSFDWEEGRIASSVESSSNKYVRNVIKPNRVPSKVPPWFYPILGVMFTVSMAVIVVFVIKILEPDDITSGIWIPDVIPDQFQEVEFAQQEVSESDLDGFRKPLDEFIMCHNERIAKEEGEDIELCGAPDNWDKNFEKKTIAVLLQLSKYKDYWKVIHKAKPKYAQVLEALDEAKMPQVFAAIALQESRYKSNQVSPVCAGGIWQFMPEVALRVGLKVESCKMEKGNEPLPLKGLVVPRPASYIGKTPRPEGGVKYFCKLGRDGVGVRRCKKDERFDFAKSTQAAIRLFEEAWENPELRSSGSIVQITILAHNAGFDDAQFGKVSRPTCLLPAYKRYKKLKTRNGGDFTGINFYGDNITCVGKDAHKDYNSLCNGFLPNQTQQYGYRVVAKHLLSVCYYAKNFGNEPYFSEWKKKYVGEGRYCDLIKVPEVDSLDVEK